MTKFSSKITTSEGRGLSSEIRVEGLDSTLAALRAFQPDVLKAMNERIRAALTRVMRRADSSGPEQVKGGYVIRSSSRGKRAGMRIVAQSRDAAIFEFAGTRGLSRMGGPITPQGAAMVRWLDRDFGKPGRILWAAWDREEAATLREVKDAIHDAERQLQRHLDATGVGY